MLIPLTYLIQKYNVQFKGILHVGAHECEELEEYEKYLSRQQILWVEAMPDKVDFCKRKYPNVRIECALVSDRVETVTFHRANNGQSSSILEFGLHQYQFPQVQYVSSEKRKTCPLSTILDKHDIPINFLNLDIQGTELKALKGMESYLPNVDYIYTEINTDYVYQDCALVKEIDGYLMQFGFYRVETQLFHGSEWGDAFYVKRCM